MKVNLDGLLNNAARCIKNGAVAFSIRELQENLQKVRSAHEEGRSKEILDEFFGLYVTQKPTQSEAA